MRVTEEAMWRGMAAAALGGHVSDISHAVEQLRPEPGRLRDRRRTTRATASGRPCTSRRTYPTTAGPARAPGSSKASPSPSSRWSSPGTPATHVADDRWTVRTDDGSLAAHFEHTFTLTARGAWVLTALDGGEAKLAELGSPSGATDQPDARAD